jgi:hypothetical protein
MTGMIDLLDDVSNEIALLSTPSMRASEVAEGHDCHGCGVANDDVDLWAEDTETGEQLWLCPSCGEW